VERELTFMRAVIFGSVLLLGALSMTLTVRALRLWRREQRRSAHESKLARELSSMASHELRRPLQQLALAADLLQHDHLLGDAERARLLQRLQDSAAQLALLSDLSRLEDVYATPSLDLATVLLAPILTPFAGPRVKLILAHDVMWAVDAHRLEQIVSNLVENALKYSSGEVTLELRATSAGPEIYVVDSGIGIPPQDRERVFEPFYRAPGVSAPGHGLGLAIARRFARAHGGDLHFEDVAEGGTRAVLKLTGSAEPRGTVSGVWRPSKRERRIDLPPEPLR
jgi:signal transduction histidine kinase